MDRLPDRTAKAGDPHDLNDLVRLPGNHRLVGGVGFERAARRAVGLRQHAVRQRRQAGHGEARSGELSRAGNRSSGADQAAGLQRLRQGLLRRVRQVEQAVKGVYLRGGAEQHPGPARRQLLSQGPQKGGFSAAAYDGGDAGADAQPFGQRHGRFSLSLFSL